jgi:DNA-binding SARP family transcriptional activator/WD40 repeat protein
MSIESGGGYRRRMEFRVLGSIEVSENGGGPIPIGGPKQRAVLAHLLLRANHLVRTEVLIDEVWGEEPPEAARNSLQSYASHLRKALGPGRLDGSRAGYLLRAEPSEVDALRFQTRLRDARRLLPIDAGAAVAAFDHALEIWRGPAFADLAEEPSLRAEAVRLDELRLSALEDRIEALLSLGDHGEVIGELEGLTGRYPLRERLWGQLLIACYRAGRQAEALAAYERARTILADELGIDPSPELRRIHERILQQSPDLEVRGEPLRGYRLLERVGEGSLGVLYRATQPHLGREVAVRVVHEHLASDPAFVRRFEPEAQAVAALEHPHVAPVYDYWRESGRAYLVSRFLRGGSLRDLLDASPVERARATRMLEQVSSAIGAAHRREIVHGGLHPSNVLFDDEGNAYVSDFRVGIGTTTRDDDLDAVADLAKETLGGRADASTLLAELAPMLGPTPSAGAGTNVRNPYKGLRPFSEADAPDFYGREALVERLLVRLSGSGQAARFVAVVGPSGSGKSSAVRAGLVAAIRRGAIPGSDAWFVTDLHPGHHPLEELEAALVRVAVRPPAGLLAQLESGPRGLLNAVDGLLPEGAELLLVVDQFEEVFTQTEDEAERALLLESLRVSTADPASRIRVVVTLRADFYDRPLRYPRIGELLGGTTETVAPLTPEELERAVVRPAQRAGLTVDAALVPQIAADVAEQPGTLPLVQYALTELFDRRADGRLTLDAYQEVGGVAGALAASAEHLYLARDPVGRDAVRQLFLRLVTIGEGTADTRRRVRLSELSTIEVDQPALDSALEAYGRHRLLTFDRDPATREPTVEVAHEAILGGWARLGTWVDDAREDLRQHRWLAQSASEWEGSGREPSFLVRGARLDHAEGWASGTELALTRPERAFLAESVASRDAEAAAETARVERERVLQRRSLRRARALVAVLAAAALVATALTTIAVSQNASAQRASRLATARELAGKAAAALGTDRDLAILLALQAVDTVAKDGRVIPEAMEVLWQAAPASAARSLGGFSDVSFTPDLRFVAIVASDGATGVWELATGRRILTVSGEAGPINDCPPIDEGTCDAIVHAALSPDGSRLATGQADGYVRIRDIETGRVMRTIDVGPPDRGENLRAGAAPAVWFGPGGRYLIISGFGVWIWDSRTDAVVASDYDGGVVANAAFALAGSGVALWTNFNGGHVGMVIDAATGEFVMRPWFTTGQGGPAVAPDGESVAFAQVLTVRVWSKERARSHTMVMSGRTTDFAFSPDSQILAVGNSIGQVFLDDADSGSSIAVLDTGAASVATLAFSPDGSLLATADEIGEVRIWDLGSRRLVASIPGHPGEIVRLGFSPDGSRVAVASDDGTVLLHLVDLNDQIALARDRLRRDFTDEECRSYLHLEACPTE